MSDPCPTEIIVRVVPPAPVEITAEVGVIYVSDPGGGGGGVPLNRTLTAGQGLVGGGDLSANRTFNIDWGTGTNQVPRGDDARFTDPRTPTAHAATHTEGGADEIVVTQTQVTGLGIALAALQLLSEKGQADGYAPLDSGALLPESYIPAGIVRTGDMTAAIGVAVDALIASAPGLLNTLAELAQALGDDPAFATTMTNLIATKVAKSLYNANTILVANTDDTPVALDVAEQTLIGRVTGGNIAALTGSQIKTLLAITLGDVSGLTSAVDAKVADAINDGVTTVAPSQNAVFDALALKAPLASPTFTGTPAAPTAAQGTNTTQVATTAYVQTETATKLSTTGGGKDTVSNLGSLTGTVGIDLANGNSFYGTLTANTTFTFTGATNAKECEFFLSVTQDSTPRSITWPTIKWPAATAPTISTASGAVDHFVFRTRDGGTTWYGYFIGKGMA